MFVKDAEYGVHCQNFRDLSATTDHASAASAQFLCSVMFCPALKLSGFRHSAHGNWPDWLRGPVESGGLPSRFGKDKSDQR